MLSKDDLALLPQEDSKTILAFELTEIDNDGFTHRDHVKVLWIYLCLWRAGALSFSQVEESVSSGLQRIAASVNAHDKYSQTITDVFIRLTAEAFLREAGEDFDAFASQNAHLLGDFQALMGRHYSKGRLAVPEARKVLLVPDLAPLPDRPAEIYAEARQQVLAG
ncbi:hypothetical protein ACTL6U_15855 [Rhodovibrionaceae bacterium A322]